MKILLVGNLNVNPERFLPLIENHEVFGIWESLSKWGVSVKPPKGYTEIPSIQLDEVADLGIDLVWSLLSPWDGLHTTLALMERFPDIPVVRQSQGGITPFWHKGGQRGRKGGNYDWGQFKAVLEGASGIMVNAAKYRECLLEQGVKIQGIPWLLSNGMAHHPELLLDPHPRPDAWGSDPHMALIGRPVDFSFFSQVGVPLHCHSNQQGVTRNAAKKYRTIRHEPYYGDVRQIQGGVSLRALLEHKKRAWAKFSRYDVGVMPRTDGTGIDVFNGIDINVPGRVNTYMMAGLPPVVENTDSGIRDFLSPHDCAVLYSSAEDLKKQLCDVDHMRNRKQRVLQARSLFTSGHEMSKAHAFFQSLGIG